jgi:putative membrane protein
LNFTGGIATLLEVSLIFTIFELILKPIIKILLLPINILTLGFFRIIIDTLGLYLALLFISSFTTNDFWIFSYHLTGILAVLTTSFIINFVFTVFNYIVSRKCKK